MPRAQPGERVQGDRNTGIDTLSGVLMLWIVAYHAFQWSHTTGSLAFVALNTLLFWRMPWLLFRSGLFSRSGTARYQPPYKLMRTAVLWEAATWLLLAALSFREVEWGSIKTYARHVFIFLKEGTTTSNLPLWYVFSLISIQFLDHRLLPNRFTVQKLLLAAALSFPVVLLGRMLPLGLHTLPICMTFYYLGRLMRLRGIAPTPRTAAFLLVPLAVALAFFGSYYDIREARVVHGSHVAYLATSLLAVLAAYHGSVLIKAPNLLAYVGRNTLPLYMSHWPVFIVVQKVAAPHTTSQPLLCLLYFTCATGLYACYQLTKELVGSRSPAMA